MAPDDAPSQSELDAGTRQLASLRYRVARFKVRVVAGPSAGAELAAGGDEITVGSDVQCDVYLGDATVSRQHCALVATTEGIRLTDLGSTNGTIIAGCRVDAALLAPGVRVTLGDSQIVVETIDGTISEPISPSAQFGGIVGTSIAMRRMFAVLPKVAKSSATVLVEGETGTGKSMLAEAIHNESARREHPFVVVDCGAIPPSLIESELFGHEKGAFTGATTARVGYFEAAGEGTIFLDEIGELPLEMQPKLLRALQDRVVHRVGAHTPIAVGARVIAATNRDLRKEVNQGTFRADLWYRLATIRLRIPPLRERPEDIPYLVSYLWETLSRLESPDAAGATSAPADLVSRLSRQPWPGNVRELRSAIERALLFDGDPDLWQAIMSPDILSSGTIDENPLPTEGLSFREAKAQATARWEHEYLSELISSSNGNISRAARAAHMNRNHLRELLVRHKIELPGRS